MTFIIYGTNGICLHWNNTKASACWLCYGPLHTVLYHKFTKTSLKTFHYYPLDISVALSPTNQSWTKHWKSELVQIDFGLAPDLLLLSCYLTRFGIIAQLCVQSWALHSPSQAPYDKQTWIPGELVRLNKGLTKEGWAEAVRLLAGNPLWLAHIQWQGPRSLPCAVVSILSLH